MGSGRGPMRTEGGQPSAAGLYSRARPQVKAIQKISAAQPDWKKKNAGPALTDAGPAETVLN